MKVLIIFLGLTAFTALAQNCNTDVPNTAPTSRFNVGADGTVTDNLHKLMWMQCSLGQTWDGSDCVGDADELTWQQALKTAHGYSFANKTGWRLPNIKELETLVERRCERPALNETVFPSSQSDDYWTSTPVATDPVRAWAIAFFNGSNTARTKQAFLFTRLVRNAN
ncbi:DUF1566 domain-containing protein [Aestuariibacter sp. AA17]|uniref:DUF1566 domain-containing protein n=1 Tax=Fluctibacter corallii TaxID=2984329 RepID=A0ABT3A911_9ALTE|nr:DUF1566 domain-containing protein [Aestuariibacter sp. AA17]MCV2884806.1 DUF1566 domain-containing protein [Aestuariibacter sp. AA17]